MFLKGKSIVPVILFLGVVILLVLMFSSNSYVPYSRTSTFHTYSNYEGFDEGKDMATGADTEKTKSEESKEKEVKKTHELIVDSSVQSSDNKEAFEDRMSQTVLGYSSLTDVRIIDKFSQVNPAIKPVDCYSAGLSNSKGPICLTPELIELLKTRGGNM